LDTNTGRHIIIDPGVYMVDAETSINIPSNSYITWLPGAEFRAIPTSNQNYEVVSIRDVQNVHLFNPTIRGEKDEHLVANVSSLTSAGTTATITTAAPHGIDSIAYAYVIGADQSEYNGYHLLTRTSDTTATYTFVGSGTPTATGAITLAIGEQGHCLQIAGSTTDDIHIHNPKCSHAWGDGIAIRYGSNVHIYDGIFEFVRRNAITINAGVNVHFHGTTVAQHASGIPPEAGVDIEPNNAVNPLRNVMFDNLYTASNTGCGLNFHMKNWAYKGFDRDLNIYIGKHEDKGSVYGTQIDVCPVCPVVANVTLTDTGDLVTYTNQPFKAGDVIRFNTITTTTGISTYTNYWVVNPTVNTFQLASAPGGAALPLTNNGFATITTTLKGKLVFDSQTYVDNVSCGVYYNDYGASNTPTVVMNDLTIIDPNDGNSSSIQFGSGFSFDRKGSSSYTNNIGNLVLDKLTVKDVRQTTRMTYGITGLDNALSGAELENVKIMRPVEISGYDSSATELQATRINIPGLVMSDPYGQFDHEVVGTSYTLSKNVYRRVIGNNVSLVTIVDDIPMDNSGVDLEVVNIGAGGTRFDPKATRAIYPLSATNGKYVESTDIGASLTLRMDFDNDRWYVVNQVGNWTVEP
jgi:hypothetical protein